MSRQIQKKQIKPTREPIIRPVCTRLSSAKYTKTQKRPTKPITLKQWGRQFSINRIDHFTKNKPKCKNIKIDKLGSRKMYYEAKSRCKSKSAYIIALTSIFVRKRNRTCLLKTQSHIYIYIYIYIFIHIYIYIYV